MKIKTQLYLLVTGSVLIPLFIFTANTINRFFDDSHREISNLAKMYELPEPPILARLAPMMIILAILLFSFGMSLFIIRSITRSVAVLEDATRRIANGELDLAVDVGGSNEITSLSNSLNKMRNTLKEEENRRYFFIMGITHDLKTPLSLIKANVEAIEDGIAANPEEQKHSLKIINNKVDELEGMINNLLDYIRMDSGEAAQNMCVTNLTGFLSTFIERVTIDAELLHHKVVSNINLPDSLAVKMDSLLIQRALDNIVNNCFRYTPKGSSLFISAGFDGKTVNLTVSDNGNGISQKDLRYIFDLFYRGSSSRGEQGLGMGLAVAKSIIDSHGWSISAVNIGSKNFNTNQTGACFLITIPVTA